jgi:GTP-binding protein
MSQEELTTESTRLVFDIATRGILGLRGVLLTLSKGTAILSSMFVRYEKVGPALPKLRKGAVIASHSGKAVPYGLISAHDKGPVFIGPQTQVYQGMVVGLNGRDEDLEVNVCKEKQLTNNRSVGEEGITIPPPVDMSLEQYLALIEDDELLEITPLSLRLRKKILDPNARRRSANRGN